MFEEVSFESRQELTAGDGKKRLGEVLVLGALRSQSDEGRVSQSLGMK